MRPSSSTRCRARLKTRLTWRQWGLIVGCLLSLTSTQAQVELLFAQPPRQRVIRLLAYPYWLLGDSARVVNHLDSVALAASRYDDEYLFWYAQYRKIRFQLDHRPKLAQGLQLLEAARPQLESCPLPAIQAAYWHMYGLYLLDARQFRDAFRLLLRAQQQFEKIGYANVPGIIEFLYGMGSLYFRFGDYRQAIHYLSLAERYHPPYQLRLRTAVLNTLGVAYDELHDYTRADHSFRLALGEAQAMGDTTYLGIVVGNLGNALRLQNRPRQALPYLYQGLSLNQKSAPENGATLCLYIANALLELDSTAKAQAYLTQSERLVAHQQPQREYAIQYSEARARYARKTGDLGQAIRWTDSSIARRERLRAIFDGKRLLATQNSLNAQQYLNRLQSLESQRLNAVRIRNLILVALVLLTAVGLYALHQNRQKRLQQQRVYQGQLAHATEQLSQYLASLHDKNELIAQITDELAQTRELAQPSAPSTPQTEQAIQTLLGSVILTETDWQQFRRRFEGVYPHFFDTLHRQYPDLSPADVRLLALSKLGISTKEMAFMLGVSMEAVYKSRHRLRKKLELAGSATDLQGLIAQL